MIFSLALPTNGLSVAISGDFPDESPKVMSTCRPRHGCLFHIVGPKAATWAVSGNTAAVRGGGSEIDWATLTNVTITDNASPDGGDVYRGGAVNSYETLVQYPGV